MPFKYGIATVTALPHLFVRAEVEIGGKLQVGVAAENLAPKWFTKDPTTTFDADVADMLEVIRAANRFAEETATGSTPFDLWKQTYAAQQDWARTTPHPPLLWSFGVSLIERAVIDAFCRATNQTFADALRANTLGIRLADLHPELAGAAPCDVLPPAPLSTLAVRHTIGLADPLTDAEIPPDEELDDGLPQSLEACIAAYGLRYFKIKLAGDADRDAARLRAIAALLSGHAGARFTLDGNENYRDVDTLRAMWSQVAREPFMAGLIALEQPLHRDAALSDETTKELRAWLERPPMIIDESDDSIDAAARALRAGYHGTSFKSCKGVFKGIANACLMTRRRAILTAEDLSTVGPVSLPQDLAVVASLGIPHVERNGHHYFRGLSAFPPDLQKAMLAHPDLYHAAPGFPTLCITGGQIALDSVVAAPFGCAVECDPSRLPSP